MWSGGEASKARLLPTTSRRSAAAKLSCLGWVGRTACGAFYKAGETPALPGIPGLFGVPVVVGAFL